MAQGLCVSRWPLCRADARELPAAIARLGEHGQTIRVPIVRLTASDGAHGFGLSRVDQETARGLLGKRV